MTPRGDHRQLESHELETSWPSHRHMRVHPDNEPLEDPQTAFTRKREPVKEKGPDSVVGSSRYDVLKE